MLKLFSACVPFVSGLNLAYTATLTASAPYTDGTLTADITVINNRKISYVPTANNWHSHLFSTAESSTPVELKLDFG